MAKHDVEFRVSFDGDAAVVALSGELDVATAELVDAVLDDVRGAGAALVAVDSEQVTFMDVAALRVFLTQLAKYEAARGHLVIVKPSSAVRRLIELTLTEDSLLPVARRRSVRR